MKNKRTKRPADVYQAISYVRGNSFELDGLSTARTLVRASNLPELAQWSSRRFHLGRGGRALTPKTVQQISAAQPLTEIGFSKEIVWSVAIARQHIRKLTQYVHLRGTLDNQLVSHDFEAALQTSDLINRQICWSLEGLNHTIALTGRVHGLERQKRWIHENVSDAKSIATRFFGYWFGVRSEELSSPEQYLQDVQRRIYAITGGPVQAAFLTYQLSRETIKEAEAEFILRSLNVHSIIDQYEAMVALAQEAAVHMWNCSEPIYTVLLPLMISLNDPRALPIAALMGSQEAVAILPTSFNLGVVECDDARATLQRLDDEAAWQEPDETTATRSGRAFTLRDHVVNLGHWPSEKDDSESEFLKYALTFPRTTLGEWARSVGPLSNERVGQPSVSARRRKLCSTGILSELDLASIPAELATEVRNRLLEGGPAEHTAAALYAIGLADDHPPNTSQHQVRISRLGRMLREGQNADAERLAIDWLGERRPPVRIAIEAATLCPAWRSDMSTAISKAAAHYLADRDLKSWIPFNQLRQEINDKELEQQFIHPATLIFLNALGAQRDDELRSKLNFALERLLESLNVGRPSEITSSQISDVPLLAYILREVATIETIRLSIEYDTVESVENERSYVLLQLKLLEPEQAGRYDTEIARIQRAQVVRKALQVVTESRISIDESNLREWAHETTGEKFIRFRSYIDAGLYPVHANLETELFAALEAGTLTDTNYSVPENDVIALFGDIFHSLTTAYNLDAKHGVNSYLSLRIRHGAAAGQLQRPCQEAGILWSEAGSQSIPDAPWGNELLALPEDEVSVIARAISKFTQAYETRIKSFVSNEIQFANSDTPKGWIKFAANRTIVAVFANDATEIDSFDDFLEAFEKIYYILLDQALSGIRHSVQNSLRSDLFSLVDELDQELLRNNRSQLIPALRDAIVRTRSELGLSLDQLANWFQLPQTVESMPLKIEDLVEVSRLMVVNIAPDFDPKITITNEFDEPLAQSLQIMTDIFYLVFGNIHRHSDLAEPAVIITVKGTDEGNMKLIITNSCADVSEGSERLNLVRTRLDDGDFSETVSREGGSGFFKLAKLIDSTVEYERLSFWTDEEHNLFTTQILLPIRYFNVG